MRPTDKPGSVELAELPFEVEAQEVGGEASAGNLTPAVSPAEIIDKISFDINNKQLSDADYLNELKVLLSLDSEFIDTNADAILKILQESTNPIEDTLEFLGISDKAERIKISNELLNLVKRYLSKKKPTYSVRTIIIKGLQNAQKKEKLKEIEQNSLVNQITLSIGVVFGISIEQDEVENLFFSNSKAIKKLAAEASHISEIQNEITRIIATTIREICIKNNTLFTSESLNRFRPYLDEIAEAIIKFYELKPGKSNFIELFNEYVEDVNALDISLIWGLLVENFARLYSQRKNDTPIDIYELNGLPAMNSPENQFIREYDENSFKLNLKKSILGGALKILKRKKISLQVDEDQSRIDSIEAISEKIEEELAVGTYSVNTKLLTKLQKIFEENNLDFGKFLIEYTLKTNAETTHEDDKNDEAQTKLNIVETVDSTLKSNFTLAETAYNHLTSDRLEGEFPVLDFSNLQCIIDRIRNITVTDRASFKSIRNPIAELSLLYTAVTVNAKYSKKISEEVTNGFYRKIVSSDKFVLRNENGRSYFEFLDLPGAKLHIGKPKDFAAVMRKMIAKGLSLDGIESSSLENLVKDHCRFTVTCDKKYFESKEDLVAASSVILTEICKIIGTDTHDSKTKFVINDKSNPNSTGRRRSAQFTFEFRTFRFYKEDRKYVINIPGEVQIVPEEDFVLDENSPDYEAYMQERNEYESNNKAQALRNLGCDTTFEEFFEQNIARAIHERIYDGVTANDRETEEFMLEVDKRIANIRKQAAEQANDVLLNVHMPKTESAKYFTRIINILNGGDQESLVKWIFNRCATREFHKRPYLIVAGKLVEIANGLHSEAEKKRFLDASRVISDIVANTLSLDSY
jgi:hypothetical protein